MQSTAQAASGVAIAILATLGLLSLTIIIGQQQRQELGLYFAYQGLTLVLTAIVVVLVRFVVKAEWPRWGELRAPARPVAVLGIRQGESWGKVGLTFAVIISAVTAAFVGSANWEEFSSASWSSIALAAIVAVPLSASNALCEEVITRWAVVASMRGQLSNLAPWVSALIFGGVHWFGIPGGPVGSLMAGFLGWLLARQIQDTRGIGWPWIIHFCQDMIIFTVTIAIFI